MGWVKETWEEEGQGVQGVTDLNVTKKIKRIGDYSLEIILSLKGANEKYPQRHPTQNSGEVYVNVSENPPEGMEEGIEGSLNLDNKSLSLWVYVPKGIGAGGDPRRSNGVQLFAKSVLNLGTDKEKWCSKYSKWYNLSGKEGKWFKIELKVDKNKQYGTYIEDCFDPKRIVIIGFKVGIGDYSKENYEGPIYIDAVDWE